jgi:hypothetical protein
VLVTFWARIIVTIDTGFASRAISSVPVVGTEQKLNQINRKPIAMLIAFFVGEFGRLLCFAIKKKCVAYFLGRKIVTIDTGFVLRAISSVAVVGTEQKLDQINRKPIAMLIAFFVGEFGRLLCFSIKKSVLLTFWARKIVTMNVDVAVSAISSVPVGYPNNITSYC